MIGTVMDGDLAEECKEAIVSLQWVMRNMPVEFALHDECPVDRLMHVLGLIPRLLEASAKRPDAFDVARLRHAYEHLAAGRVVNQKEFADGLIAPVIRRMEEQQ